LIIFRNCQINANDNTSILATQLWWQLVVVLDHFAVDNLIVVSNQIKHVFTLPCDTAGNTTLHSLDGSFIRKFSRPCAFALLYNWPFNERAIYLVTFDQIL